MSLLILAAPWLAWRSVSTGRYRTGWKDRLWGPSLSKSSQDSLGPNIWLHAVSVGEVLLLAPIIEGLRKRFPTANFFVSATTDTGLEIARDKYSDATVLRLPLDFSWAVHRAIRQIQPSVLLLAELELWPNLLAVCERESVLVAVVNGRLSEKSFRGYRKLRLLTQSMFRRLNLVCASAPNYASHFEQCGTPKTRIATTGSIKFDNVSFSRDGEAVRSLRALSGLEESRHSVLLAGSTQREEERIAIDAYAGLVGTGGSTHSHWKLIVAPRHPERTKEILRYAAEVTPQLRTQQRTQIQGSVAAGDWDILVVDCVGELSNWWGLADVALVGGTFGARGGQNMIEPAARGCNVVFGPSTRNFRDVVRMLLDADAATELANEQEFAPWLAKQIREPAPAKRRSKRAVELIMQQQGALEKTLRQIESLIKAPEANS